MYTAELDDIVPDESCRRIYIEEIQPQMDYLPRLLADGHLHLHRIQDQIMVDVCDYVRHRLSCWHWFMLLDTIVLQLGVVSRAQGSYHWNHLRSIWSHFFYVWLYNNSYSKSGKHQAMDTQRWLWHNRPSFSNRSVRQRSPHASSMPNGLDRLCHLVCADDK